MIQTASASCLLQASLPLEDGGLLFNAEIAYQTYGRPSGESSIVLLHDLAHSHRALGPTEISAYQPSGWGQPLVGERRPVDPLLQCVIAPNALGSPFGSTSPCSKDPENGRPLGPIFPPITLDDMARATAAFVRGMSLRRVRALVGYGMGGMLALRVASLFPELAAGVIALGAARALPQKLRERVSRTGAALAADPAFQEGSYGAGGGPRETLKALRLEWLRLTSTREQLLAQHLDPSASERALEAQAQGFAQGFDANCYATLCAAYARADIGPGLRKISCPVLLVAASTSAVAPPAHVRDTERILAAAGVRAQVHEHVTELGQQGLISEADQLRGAVGGFLASLA